MKLPFLLFSAFHLLLPFAVQAKPENLNLLFQRWSEVKNPLKGAKQRKSKKNVNSAPASVAMPLPPEYETYFEAKSFIEQKVPSRASAIEAMEKKILAVRLNAESRVLEKEFEEFFFALELKRAIRYSKMKVWDLSMKSFERAVGGFHAFKLIYYWDDEASKALKKVIEQQLKRKEEGGLLLAKKVIEAFPKSANETKDLKELPAPEIAVPNPEGSSAERLSQGYTEKTEKDEEAFAPVLQDFLQGHEADLMIHGNEFVKNFPKSILRFRVLFLMAEMDFKRNRLKEAKEKYGQIITEIPLSFYAAVSAERSGLSLKDFIKNDPIVVDLDQLSLQGSEKKTLARAESLWLKKHFDEVAFELDSLTRVKSYSDQTLLYLMGLGTQADQSLSAFRLANELIQRRYQGLLQNDFLEMIFPNRFSEAIEESAKFNKIDPIWVLSLMKQESGFKAAILSSSGALGLMQLMPFTALEVQANLSLKQLKEPAVNIAVGTKYLASLAEKYAGNMVYALAAYNAGPNRVAKWKKDALPEWGELEFIEAIPYKETREYVMSILRNRYWYALRRGLSPASVLNAGFDLKK